MKEEVYKVGAPSFPVVFTLQDGLLQALDNVIEVQDREGRKGEPNQNERREGQLLQTEQE